MKNKLGVAFLALAIAVAWRVAPREEAPINAGTFLEYDNAGMQMRLPFLPADGDRFDTNVSYAGENGTVRTRRPSRRLSRATPSIRACEPPMVWSSNWARSDRCGCHRARCMRAEGLTVLE